MKKTPLYDEHLALNAKMVHFGDWLMPLSYSSMVDEHNSVRKNTGIFDVSHMGEIEVSGKGALDFINYWTPNNVAKLSVGKAHYTVILKENGTIVDDMLVYRLKEDSFLLVVNALNIEKDYDYLISKGHDDTEILNRSDEYAQIAVQGRYAVNIIEKLTNRDCSELPLFSFFLHNNIIISRTGYTGEDGFELYMENSKAPSIWKSLIELGADHGITPCGLGSRDSLRLEAGLPLYGHELDENTTPIEADLSWIVKFKKGDFISKDILKKQKKEGTEKLLIGLEISDKSIPRKDYKIFCDGEEIGIVTSGTKSPFTKKSIAMGYVPPIYNNDESKLFIQIRNKMISANIVKKSFFNRDY